MFLFDRKLVCYLVGLSNYPAAGIPRRLLVDAVLGGGGGRLLCVAGRLTSSVRTDAVSIVERTAVLVDVGVGRPSSGLCPTGSVSSPPSSLASTSEAAALLQGEEDGSPGTVVLSNPAVRQG